jgi:Chaperone of endosialidase
MTTDFNAFADASRLLDTDVFLITRAGAGMNVLGINIAKQSSGGAIVEGFGGITTGGVTNWNDVSNARSGQGETLLLGSAANGPGQGYYYHPFSFEYQSKDGSGNLTQFAIPYHSPTLAQFYLRTRFSNVWEPWRQILMEGATGFAPISDNAKSLGYSSQRFSVVYAGTGSINTSDEREKENISAIPDEWLDAWADVEWCRFMFKGGKRWHIGLVAQRVHAAFAAHGLDAFEIGLCCFDQWNERRVPEMTVNEAGEAAPTGKELIEKEAGDRWGLRYDECFAIEAAWHRRELTRLHELLTVNAGQ